MELSKETVLKALTAGKKFKFVESEKEVDAYYNKQVYAIKKDSAILRELVKEGKFPIDNRILNLQGGYYHIIDIYQKSGDIKSQTKIEDIAFALYKEKETGDFWNTVYQIRLKPLTNYISERLFSIDNNVYNLIGKTIRIFSFGLNEEAHSYKVSWEGMEEIEIRLNEIEYENYVIDKINEEKVRNEIEYENYEIDQEMQRIKEEQEMCEYYLMEQEIQAEEGMYDEPDFYEEDNM